MTEFAPNRPPLWRQTPVMATGAVAFAGLVFLIGWLVGHSQSAPPVVTPPATSPTANILPESAPQIPPPGATDSPPPAAAGPSLLTVPPEPAPVSSPPASPAPPPSDQAAPDKPRAPKPVAAKPLQTPHAARPEPVETPAPVKPHPAPAKPQAVAAKPPAAEDSDRAAPPPRPAAKTLPSPVADGAWVVQLGAFQSEDHAKLLVMTLQAHGQQAHVTTGEDKAGHQLFLVHSLRYQSREAAQQVAEHLAAREHVSAFVTRRAE